MAFTRSLTGRWLGMLVLVMALTIDPSCAEEKETSAAQGAAQDGSAETLEIDLKIEDDKGIYTPGDLLGFVFRTNKDCYVVLLNYGSSGAVTQIFPNELESNGFIKAGRERRIPVKNGTFLFRLKGPEGYEKVVAYASLEPMKSFEAAQRSKVGHYRKFTHPDALEQAISAEERGALEGKTAQHLVPFYVEPKDQSAPDPREDSK